MPGYLFFPVANVAQDEIWRYTCKTWGKKQAEKYIIGLHRHLQELSEKKRLWPPLPTKLVVPPDLDLDIYFSRYEHHYLFFRKLSVGNIGVMSILHERSDMPVRLCEDLNSATSLLFTGNI